MPKQMNLKKKERKKKEEEEEETVHEIASMS